MTNAPAYLDYYIFCFMDGTFRISERVEHQWNGKPNLPRKYLDGIYETERDAEAALAQARKAAA